MFSDRDRFSRVALVIPIEIFHDFTEKDPSIVKNAKNNGDNKNNVVVITSSVDAYDNDRFFVCSAFVFKGARDTLKNFVFCREDLFPEIRRAYEKKLRDEDSYKVVHTYDVLKNALKDRMVTLNDLSSQNIERMFRYRMIRDHEFDFRYAPTDYADIVNRWYLSREFRRDHPELLLPENALHKMSVIEANISVNFLKNANAIIKKEKDEHISIKTERDNGGIFYDPESSKHKPQYITEQIITFRDIIIRKGYVRQFKDGIVRELDSLEEFFSLPSYQSQYIEPFLPHDRLEMDKDDTAGQLLKKLGAADDWNAWDLGAMLILADFYRLCLNCAKQKTGQDYANEQGYRGFELTRIALGKCMSMSQKQSFNNNYYSDAICELIHSPQNENEILDGFNSFKNKQLERMGIKKDDIHRAEAETQLDEVRVNIRVAYDIVKNRKMGKY